MLAMHNKYGPVVRIGPDKLSFSSSQAFQDIYAASPNKPQFAKDSKLYAEKPNGIRDSLIGILDNETHSRHRRLLSHAFSDKSLPENEGIVISLVDLFFSRLPERTIKGKGHKAKENMTD
ncbi:cytochrome P450 [Penicillium longicatenatum]|uniref:cytochrome P450 n=1 Tax=Penicillium longicatenatum TaxID=1561947 RepID=UPI002548BBD0|nr:cytochrome P450 [Penicillium longicatenatum]KAJ5657958.1 cytochrome P450 [Penicillium longicatenatum]